MSLEEAKFVLSNVEIDAPSIRSQVFFGENEVNNAIEKVLETLEEQEKKISKLESQINAILTEHNLINSSKHDQENLLLKLKSSLKVVKDYSSVNSF